MQSKNCNIVWCVYSIHKNKLATISQIRGKNLYIIIFIYITLIRIYSCKVLTPHMKKYNFKYNIN